jgi:hypothetical protein
MYVSRLKKQRGREWGAIVDIEAGIVCTYLIWTGAVKLRELRLTVAEGGGYAIEQEVEDEFDFNFDD